MPASILLCLVVSITDGDTLKARCGEPGHYQQITVRLAAIDAPESRQPFGNASRRKLAALCFDQQATITPRANDRYGRVVADVSCRNTDAATALVSSGMAWVYERYAHSAHDAALFNIQATAQAGNIGLWSNADPIPPWRWRQATKKPQ
ncbi:endonuclease YncB(thermonuclease family) [Acidovorax sp. 62]|uniref:thermonuclease family protein n=1 Tax=Acidovorax sp. 62 TaxID=2035203 RepID=UPI000C1A647F|nr:thermonuclease family protein [Acidovorax sp. 62]PIF89755.1 endonuclease YncB(thermonuclease family) [Acidovorax sp. 62]